jgi:PAS domain S-box-containing protein
MGVRNMHETLSATYPVITKESVVPPVRLKRRMKLCLILCFLILCCNGPCVSASHAQGQPQTALSSKTVLILHAHEASAPVFSRTDHGLLTKLESGGVPALNQFYESLELRRYPLPEQRKLLIDQLRMRYAGRKIDLIITMYPEALEFVTNECKSIFADVPILAMYLPQGFELRKPEQHIIQHSASVDVPGTVNLSFRLAPNAKRVYVVSGTHPIDREREKQVRRELSMRHPPVDISYLSQMPFDKILAALSDAPSDSIVLLLPFSQDVTGKGYTAPNVAELLSTVSKAPIFGTLGVSLGHGIVGGSLISFEAIGAKAGELVLQILRGSFSYPNMPMILDVPPGPMFDWRQLKRWNLSESALPERSIIINREFTLWDLKYYTIPALAFILAQSFLIFKLLAQNRRRRSAEESLRQKTEELNQFFNVTLDLLCIANTGGYFLRLNPAWEKTLGYSREELMANRFFDYVHPDDLAATQETVSKLASQRELVHFENRYRCKDGTYRFLEWAAASAGVLIYAAARDMTERLEVETEARQRREEIAHMARVAMLGELTASLAHEINQPLSAIMSNAQAAKRFLNAPKPDVEEVKEIIADIVKEDTRAGEVINRLRGLLKKGKTETEFESLDLNLIFKEVVGLLHSDAVIRDVRIDFELEPLLPLVRGDRIQLQQVALNLVMNAFEALNARPRGERWIQIRTGLKDSQVLAAVTDNGTGVITGDVEKVFQPFYTTKAQGLGMGLSISRSIVMRHQGRIWAENNPGSGTTIYFSLPVTA